MAMAWLANQCGAERINGAQCGAVYDSEHRRPLHTCEMPDAAQCGAVQISSGEAMRFDVARRLGARTRVDACGHETLSVALRLLKFTAAL